jgi:hypothetical protein
MGEVIAHLAMSLDGFIADPDDGCDELFGFYGSGDVAVKLTAGGSTTSPTAGTAIPSARCRWSWSPICATTCERRADSWESSVWT